MKIEDAIIRVVDCETTGLDPKEHKVVEIACVDMSYKDGILNSTSQLINPKCDIPISAMAVHHITKDMVKEAPDMNDIWPNLKTGSFHAFAAHNAKFDFSFLDAELPKICSLRLAKHLWPNLESHTNQYLRYYLGAEVDPNIPIHRALGDATVTAEVLRRMLGIAVNEHGISEVEELISWIEKPVLLGTCMFGSKHRGEKWADVPKSYLRWMKEKVTDMDEDTAHTVEYYLSV